MKKNFLSILALSLALTSGSAFASVQSPEEKTQIEQPQVVKVKKTEPSFWDSIVSFGSDLGSKITTNANEFSTQVQKGFDNLGQDINDGVQHIENGMNQLKGDVAQGMDSFLETVITQDVKDEFLRQDREFVKEGGPEKAIYSSVLTPEEVKAHVEKDPSVVPHFAQVNPKAMIEVNPKAMIEINRDDINANASKIKVNRDDIIANASKIEANKKAVSANVKNIAGLSQNLSQLTDDIALHKSVNEARVTKIEGRTTALEGRMTATESNVSKLQKESKNMKGALAATAALIQTGNTPRTPGQVDLNVGIGYYDTATAVAVGISGSAALSEKTNLGYNLGVGMGSHQNGPVVRAGLGINLN
jgi:chaperonin cofactor prefoldin